MFIHDGHSGLKSGLVTLYPVVKQQDCIKHKEDNVLRVTRDEHKEAIMSELRGLYSSVSYPDALSKKSMFDKKWCKVEPNAVSSLSFDFKNTITYLKLGLELQKKVRTNNPIERFIEEIRRRTIPMRYFQNTESFDRLIYGIVSILNVNIRYGIYQRSKYYFHPDW